MSAKLKNLYALLTVVSIVFTALSLSAWINPKFKPGLSHSESNSPIELRKTP